MPDLQELLKELTLEEKQLFVRGYKLANNPIRRLGIPSIFMADGPHGIKGNWGKKVDNISGSSIPSTCFPPAVTLASLG